MFLWGYQPVVSFLVLSLSGAGIKATLIIFCPAYQFHFTHVLLNSQKIFRGFYLKMSGAVHFLLKHSLTSFYHLSFLEMYYVFSIQSGLFGFCLCSLFLSPQLKNYLQKTEAIVGLASLIFLSLFPKIKKTGFFTYFSCFIIVY